jgi:hypothetical protein
MQKITAGLETGNAPDPESATESSPTIEFVYGLGSSGLTPFEFALADKTVGDEIQLQLSQNQIPAFFGHIRLPAVLAAGESDSIVLKVRVVAISPASSREVLKTLAAIANCGDSCCGHH